ncbi:hypothetical protein CYMTET_16971 [Cymbomonas tetramitiformis]|uniref:Uncharacterized protein n=1 Tax=Cymbomonas tetramitiformis TaxID=36881 RepID=A0AAE0GBI5_9CHLO|nr:hypothetical protein CYMTET_16971 [Cymbomonas tetramitiformis]
MPANVGLTMSESADDSVIKFQRGRTNTVIATNPLFSEQDREGSTLPEEQHSRPFVVARSHIDSKNNNRKSSLIQLMNIKSMHKHDEKQVAADSGAERQGTSRCASQQPERPPPTKAPACCGCLGVKNPAMEDEHDEEDRETNSETSESAGIAQSPSRDCWEERKNSEDLDPSVLEDTEKLDFWQLSALNTGAIDKVDTTAEKEACGELPDCWEVAPNSLSSENVGLSPIATAWANRASAIAWQTDHATRARQSMLNWHATGKLPDNDAG